MNHIMLDFESMSTEHNAALIQLGAVEFDPVAGELGREISINIDLTSSVDAGLHVSPSTILWWLGQSNEAQKTITDVKGTSLAQALLEFKMFYQNACANASHDKGSHIWANGPRADLNWLSSACIAVNMKPFWHYSCDKCVRTIVELGRAIGIDPKNENQFDGVEHCALDDAKFQARYCMEIWEKLTRI
ncbi:MAG: ATPase [Robiginitomaculum sp.]|nr:MAG: ATPase [Robiginitomaculum sp.]